MALSVQDQSILQPVDQSLAIVVVKDEMQNGEDPIAGSIVDASKKLQDDLEKLGYRIKEHEDSLKFLKAQRNALDDAILDKQVILGKYHTSSLPTIEDQNPYQSQNEETTEQILRHEKSAAGLFCQLRTGYITQAAHLTLTKDVLGIVAALGKVDDDNLSRLFSEYLGVDNMLAIVCKTYEGVKAVESYDKDSCINKSSGLHGLGTSIGYNLDGRFLVICLENIRPYVGEIVADDPQRRLGLLKPRLPNGECPPGFLGFAVNMINLDTPNLLYVTSNGCGLRETLFYHLFSRLQVYRTRVEMRNALPCINDGALSLDGGMIKTTGVFSLGYRGDIDVRFGVGSIESHLPINYFEMENEIKKMKWKKEKVIDDIKREQSMLDQTKFNFEIKKQEFVKFLAESSSYMTQHQTR